jgi:anti-anti-sigma factor
MIDFTDGGVRLHLAVLADADQLTVTLTGELDAISGPPLTDVLNTVMDDSVRYVDVDVAQVGFVDLQGLRALLRAYQMCARRDITLMLRDPQPHVVWLLKFTDTAALLLAGGTASADLEACPPAGSRRLAPVTTGVPSAGGPHATDGDHSGRPGSAETPDERDQRAREREEGADDRERLMQARDQLLDERQQRISEHQRWEDIREDLADIRERHLEHREHEQ